MIGPLDDESSTEDAQPRERAPEVRFAARGIAENEDSRCEEENRAVEQGRESREHPEADHEGRCAREQQALRLSQPAKRERGAPGAADEEQAGLLGDLRVDEEA